MLVPCSAAASVCEPVLQHADLEPAYALGAALSGKDLAVELVRSPETNLEDKHESAVLIGDCAVWIELGAAAADVGAVPGTVQIGAAHAFGPPGAAP